MECITFSAGDNRRNDLSANIIGLYKKTCPSFCFINSIVQSNRHLYSSLLAVLHYLFLDETLQVFLESLVLTSAPSVATAVPSSTSPPFFHLFLIHLFFRPQFDHSFVEVHRVRKFRFQPRYRKMLSLEDLSEPPKKATFRPICSGSTGCNYGSTHSSWNCDGEILPHAAIQVRYSTMTRMQTLVLIYSLHHTLNSNTQYSNNFR